MSGPAKIVILGAPRSGTNLLRDLLTTLPGLGTWPCDEINYIWRHGNLRHPSDALPAELARPEVVRYVRGRFDAIARAQGVETVVEKTCANSLRVPFVDRIVPDARYLFIRREGIDAVASAMERWTAPLDLPYVARKARYVPPTDVPFHASRYLLNRLYKLFGGGRLALWGPALPELPALLERHSLDEVCALQWQACVTHTRDALEELPRERWTEVAYEELVAQPAAVLERLCAFLGIEADAAARARAVSGVSTASVGRGRAVLGAPTTARLEALVGDTLAAFGYR